MLDVAAACLSIAALFAYLNHRFVGLPTAIGVMAGSLAASLALVALATAGLAPELRAYEESLLRSIDFSGLLMEGMLSFLLFAGGLHVDLERLKAYRWQISGLAVVGTLVSTLIVGVGIWLALPLVDAGIPLTYCLLFGGLISPTDPIAVMSMLKSAGVPRDVEITIAGESLFNDGVGVVVFSALLGFIASGAPPSARDALVFILREVAGGVLYGLALGFVTFRLLRSVDSYQVEVLLTLAAVMGGYSLARHLHVSGPLAMVVVGLMIGNPGRSFAMSETTRRYLDVFWELVDEILNAVLFVLIGMEILLVDLSLAVIPAVGVAVCVSLLARLITVGLPVAAFPGAFELPRKAWRILWWGGLRGGISVALALTLPAGSERDTIVTLTYGVVVFSVLVQGMSLAPVVRRSLATGRTPA